MNKKYKQLHANSQCRSCINVTECEVTLVKIKDSSDLSSIDKGVYKKYVGKKIIISDFDNFSSIAYAEEAKVYLPMRIIKEAIEELGPKYTCKARCGSIHNFHTKSGGYLYFDPYGNRGDCVKYRKRTL